MSNHVSLNDNVIDSRDIIKRHEELESDLQAQYDELQEEFDILESYYEKVLEDGEDPILTFAQYCESEMPDDRNYFEGGKMPEIANWLEAVAKDMYHTWQDEAIEYETLQAIVRQCEGYGDWAYGESLISEDYFMEYAEQLATDIGAITNDVSWPLTCIDWGAAADQLKQDYSSVDVDGSTYYIRD